MSSAESSTRWRKSRGKPSEPFGRSPRPWISASTLGTASGGMTPFAASLAASREAASSSDSAGISRGLRSFFGGFVVPYVVQTFMCQPQTLRSATKERNVRCPHCERAFRMRQPDHSAVVAAVRTLLDTVVGRPKPRETAPLSHAAPEGVVDVSRLSTAELLQLVRQTRREAGIGPYDSPPEIGAE
jgi:hypothetical protein